MKTNNTEIISIVNHMVASVNDIFNKHDVSVYIMGSLARGGFSKIASDIDLGIILKGSLDGAKEKARKLTKLSLNVLKNIDISGKDKLKNITKYLISRQN